MSNNHILVTKINGELEEYSEDKIRASASRVGVPENLQDELLKHVRSILYPKIPTKEIFHEIKKFLSKHDAPHYSTMYNLKSAILQLGPSGYPFEKYIAELLETEGYSASTNIQTQGKCVSHEIDVLASKSSEKYIIEAKFHSKQSVKTDIKVALYIKARFDDIKNGWQDKEELKPWIITNARFTSDAIAYAKCINLKLTSWDYPVSESLRELIHKTHLHPVTILDSATQKNKKSLLANGIVTCRQFVENKEKVASFIPHDQIIQMIEEAKQVCSLS